MASEARTLDLVADSAHVTFTVHFASAEAAEAAEKKLAKNGFAVSAPPDGTRFALDASMIGDVDRASVALDEALAGIEHDPLIDWHASKLTGFV